MKRCYVFGGGSLEPAFVQAWICAHRSDAVTDLFIAADSGIAAVQMLEICPDVVLGDFDSADASLLEGYRNRKDLCFEAFPARKDFTDTELAVMKAMELGAEDIVLFGATGSRLDHVLGNLYLLQEALQRNVRARIVDSHNVAELFGRGEHILKKTEQFGRYVSFLPYTDSVTLSLEGFSYPLAHRRMERVGTLGISNEIEAETATARVEDGIVICIQSRD